MNNPTKNIITILVATCLIALITGGALAAKQMPPSFSINNEPADVLRNYPLGIIKEKEAFAHHGGPIRKVVLPNGNQGWLYKAGEKAGVPSVYILEISGEGVVIDVLHKDSHYKIGHSALQYQYLSDTNVELKTLGPAPGE